MLHKNTSRCGEIKYFAKSFPGVEIEKCEPELQTVHLSPATRKTLIAAPFCLNVKASGPGRAAKKPKLVKQETAK